MAGAAPQQLLADAGKLYRAMERADFPLRAAGVAAATAALEPHVVGLQEMVLLRRDPSNFARNPMPDTGTEVVDFRAVLTQALEAEGVPVVLLGDFNSSPDIESGIDDRSAYGTLTEAGFVDMWKGGTGPTCCQRADLTRGNALSKRIDFVFARNSPRLSTPARTTPSSWATCRRTF